MPPSKKFAQAISRLRISAEHFYTMAEVEKHEANRATYMMLADDYTAAADELENKS